MDLKRVSKALELLTCEAKDLHLGSTVPELLEIPTALEFSRDYVGRNLPVVFRDCILDWPAIIKWNSKFFRNEYGTKEITVAVTPNGFADGLAHNSQDGKEYFVLPEEQCMRMDEFIDHLDKKSGPVYYIQKQNSNLTADYPELMNDIHMESFDFAKQVFNKDPDAINFWFGDERAVTSMHKDPYENIYCVISGYKDFILIPPIDLHNVPRAKYPCGIYKTDNITMSMKIEAILDSKRKPQQIEWVAIDPLNADIKKYPQYKNATVYEVRVNAGDILYLPSLWYHHVRQNHKCIAVNFWYDMDYDARYCYYKMVENLCGFGEEST